MFLSEEEIEELRETGITEEQVFSIALVLDVIVEKTGFLGYPGSDLPDYSLKFFLSFVTAAFESVNAPVMSGFGNWFLGVLRSAREKMRQASDSDPKYVFLAAIKEEMLTEYLGSAAHILAAIDEAVNECRTATANDQTLDPKTRDKILEMVRQLARRHATADCSPSTSKAVTSCSP